MKLELHELEQMRELTKRAKADVGSKEEYHNPTVLASGAVQELERYWKELGEKYKFDPFTHAVRLTTGEIVKVSPRITVTFS